MRACGKVVEDEDVRALLEQMRREMGADETRSAGDQGCLRQPAQPSGVHNRGEGYGVLSEESRGFRGLRLCRPPR